MSKRAVMVSSRKSAVRADETTDTRAMAPLKESALAGVGAALGFVALFAASQVLPMLPGDVKIMCPPLGAVAVLLFCLCALLCPSPSATARARNASNARNARNARSARSARSTPTHTDTQRHRCAPRPKAPASSTKAVVLGHLVGGAVAVTVNQFLAKGDPMAPGVSVALAIFGMKLLDCVHPPAAAYAFFAAVQGFNHPKFVLFPGLLGAVVLVAVQKVYLQLTEPKAKSS